jgi:hypothetical protein
MKAVAGASDIDFAGCTCFQRNSSLWILSSWSAPGDPQRRSRKSWLTKAIGAKITISKHVQAVLVSGKNKGVRHPRFDRVGNGVRRSDFR